MMSTLAMRIGCDHALASAVRPSIAAAMVIAEPVSGKLFTIVDFGRTVAGKCQKSDNNRRAPCENRPDFLGGGRLVSDNRVSRRPTPCSAVLTIPGIVEAQGRTNLHTLPRVAWDGRERSLRMMRVDPFRD